MTLDNLTAISPIDGRYRGKAEQLAEYFSEFALIKYRVRVEVEYFIALCELPLPQLKDVNKDVFCKLRDVYKNFSEADAQAIKDIEKITNHDVKAVEYFLKQKFDESDPDSDDITAFAKAYSGMLAQVNKLDDKIMQKRKMMGDIEKENCMTVQAALRSIPKETGKKDDSPLMKILSGGDN